VVVQKGIDLRAPEGQEVRCVAAGRVAHSGWLRGYGNLLLVDHGAGYFSLYAHLATLERKAGEELKAGDRLGAVGDTGSLKGAYLYFELRHHGTPLNPAGWLKK
jgi:septal ring factor EnvC (AmiA/AmiB activator)